MFQLVGDLAGVGERSSIGALLSLAAGLSERALTSISLCPILGKDDGSRAYKENMGLLDSIVDGQLFWRDPAGRTLFYPRGKRKAGYVVGSQAEEAKIRAFVKAHLFARLAVNSLGYFSGFGLSEYLIHTIFPRPAAAMPQAMAIMLVVLGVFLIAPALFLWRLYEWTVGAFTAGLMQAPAAPRSGFSRPAVALFAAGLVVLIIAVLMIVVMTRHR